MKKALIASILLLTANSYAKNCNDHLKHIMREDKIEHFEPNKDCIEKGNETYLRLAAQYSAFRFDSHVDVFSIKQSELNKQILEAETLLNSIEDKLSQEGYDKEALITELRINIQSKVSVIARANINILGQYRVMQGYVKDLVRDINRIEIHNFTADYHLYGFSSLEEAEQAVIHLEKYASVQVSEYPNMTPMNSPFFQRMNKINQRIGSAFQKLR